MEVTLTNLSVIVGFFTLVQSIIAFCINRHSERKNLQIKIMQGCIEQYRKCAQWPWVWSTKKFITWEKGWFRKKFEMSGSWIWLISSRYFHQRMVKKIDFENPVNMEILKNRGFHKVEWRIWKLRNDYCLEKRSAWRITKECEKSFPKKNRSGLISWEPL